MQRFTCQHCGTAFTSYNKGRKYCSHRCRATVRAEHDRKRLALVCARCGNRFERKPHRAGRFCSVACSAQTMAEQHAAQPKPWALGNKWRIGKAPSNKRPPDLPPPKSYRGWRWPEERRRAVERDGGCCRQCGKEVGSAIPVHHIRSYREFASWAEANALDNLICLCHSCHSQWHASERSALQRSYSNSRPAQTPESDIPPAPPRTR